MKNELTNKSAKALAVAALKWLNGHHNIWPTDQEMLKAGTSDYLDLMEIVNMIEAGAEKKAIAKAMWALDTIVRDQIPNKVYNAYTY